MFSKIFLDQRSINMCLFANLSLAGVLKINYTHSQGWISVVLMPKGHLLNRIFVCFIISKSVLLEGIQLYNAAQP